MPIFKYKARNKSGNNVTGVAEFDNKRQALQELSKKDLKVISIEQNNKTGLSADIKLPGSQKVKPKSLVVFTRQFSTMVSAGVPILRALSTLEEQTDSNGLKTAVQKVVKDVEAGTTLSEALSKHPKVFSEVYTNMVKAGEAGGILDKILSRLASQVEKDTEIKGKFKSAMIYPIVVVLVAVGAVSFLMVGVIPKLANILIDAGVDIPIQTRAILALSNFMMHQWYIILMFITVSVFIFRKVTANDTGKYKYHQLLLRIPIFGNIIMKVNIASFARTFSSLISAGVSVVEALDVTRKSLNNLVIQKGISDSIKEIKNGSGIAESLEHSKTLPNIIIQMAAVGEETGKLGEVLDKVAEFYEEEVDQITSGIASIIEPILIVGLGSIVGFIILSVLGPILSLQGSV